MSHVLEITLQSPLTSTGGGDWANLVDTEIDFDNIGLPILRGRRLKGLWRDGIHELNDALTQCNVSSESATTLFGRSGAGFGEDSAVNVDDGHLTGFEPGGEWRAVVELLLLKGALTRPEILGFFTGKRGQTAIDPHSGTAQENTLRVIRSLHNILAGGGVTFRAPVEMIEGTNEDLLALGAAAVQHMGLSRTRGPGKVRCRLLRAPAGTDLTTAALVTARNNNRFTFLGTRVPDPSSRQTTPAVVTQRDEAFAPTHLLRYRLELGADALLPDVTGDPNTLTTSTHIPGGTILGCFVRRFCNGTRGSDASDFGRLFLGGAVRFLAAYPEDGGNPNMRLIPAPHSLRKSKTDNKLVDLVAPPMEELDPVHRIEGRYLRCDKEPGLQEVATSLNYHHARATDRRYGRALGADVDRGGAFYSAEAISAGQTFVGAILGSTADLKILRDLFDDKTSPLLRIGKSRGVQYGGRARLGWIDPAPEPLDACGPETNTWPPTTQMPALGTTITVTCLSPLLAMNELGHPAPVFPRDELAAILDISTDEVQPAGYWTRMVVVGGFASHLHLPLQQWPAIAEGSVFYFHLKNIPAADKIKALENDGLGLRRNVGCGRVAVNLHGAVHQGRLQFTGKSPTIIVPSIGASTSKIALTKQSGAPLVQLLTGVLRNRAVRTLELEAMHLAEKADGIPSSSTLNRVFLILRDAHWQTKAVDEINRFRDKAADALKNCILGAKPGTTTRDCLNNLLDEWLTKSGEKGKAQMAVEFTKKSHSGATISQCVENANMAQTILCGEEPLLARSFLLALCRALSHKNR